MISMEQAAGQAWSRMVRLQEEESTVLLAAAVAAMCSGTDVRGPELAQHLDRTAEDGVARIAVGQNPYSIITGALARLFWMGYAFGEVAER